MQLTLAWWNTALSPTRKRDRAEPAQLDVAAGVIRRLIEAGADLIVLCEVSERDIDLLATSLGTTLDGFRVQGRLERVGGSSFDTAVIHRERLMVAAQPSVIEHHGTRLLRVAQRCTVSLPDGTSLTLFFVHWPSRRSFEAASPYRALLGRALRAEISEALASAPASALIVIGDFNDEPFDASMSEGLLSSRDRVFVELRGDLLYNPFWRHMSSCENEPGLVGSCGKGTYFHAKGDITRWRTFDQMLFSASLLTGGVSTWALDERNTLVVHDPGLATLLQTRSSIFDHLPIVGRIFRRPRDE